MEASVAFEQLAEQYTPMIHKIMHTLHIYKNKEEFFQTGLIALWDANVNFDEAKGKFSSYAYSYIKGRILTEMRIAKKHEDRSVYPDEAYWDTIEGARADEPIEEEFLQSFCSGLTEKEIKWVLYTWLNDFTIRDIAERENVSLSAVKQWRSNAKRKLLRERIDEYLD